MSKIPLVEPRRTPFPIWALWVLIALSAVLATVLFVRDLHLLSNAWSWIGGCLAVLIVQHYADRRVG